MWQKTLSLQTLFRRFKNRKKCNENVNFVPAYNYQYCTFKFIVLFWLSSKKFWSPYH